jgi:thymidylate kinase
VLRPTGLFVAILGPDGSGKSSVIAQWLPTISPAFRRVARYHLAPDVLRQRDTNAPPVTDPHGKPPRSVIGSIAKLGYLFLRYWAGYLLRVRPQMVRSTIVVFDRYYHDLLIDPRRYRYGAPLWLARAVAAMLPKPELWLLLDAPAEVLQSRKQEVTFDETVRQRDAYLQLFARLDNAHILDASQPLECVVDQANRVVLNYLASRMDARRPAAASVEFAQ